MICRPFIIVATLAIMCSFLVNTASGILDFDFVFGLFSSTGSSACGSLGNTCCDRGTIPNFPTYLCQGSLLCLKGKCATNCDVLNAVCPALSA